MNALGLETQTINGEVKASLRYKAAACDLIVSDCSGIADAAEEYMKRMYDHSLALNRLFTYNVEFRTPGLREQTCGSKPCRNSLCNSMIHGFLFTAPLQPMHEARHYVYNMVVTGSELRSNTSSVPFDELSRALAPTTPFFPDSTLMKTFEVESKRTRRNTNENLVTTYVSESEEASLGTAYNSIGVQTALDTKSGVGNGGVNNARISTGILMVCCSFAMFLVSVF
eukprot:CFRG7743T1